jgi:hypothetical protein
MRTARKQTVATVQQVVPLIEQTIALEAQAGALAEQVSANRRVIKESLSAAGLDRLATPRGAEALVIEEERLAWDADKLSYVLEPDQFVDICPRRADGGKLRAMLEALNGEQARALRSCAKASHTTRLELRPAPEKGLSD